MSKVGEATGPLGVRSTGGICPEKRVPGLEALGGLAIQLPPLSFPLPLTQGSEQLHATVFAFEKDCVVVSIVSPAHPDQNHFHCSWGERGTRRPVS